MTTNSAEYYNTIARRIAEILTITILEPEGVAEFLGMKWNSLYKVIRGKNRLGPKRLKMLASAYLLSIEQFVNPDFKLPARLGVSKEMADFMKEHKNVPSYFKATRSHGRASWFIKRCLLATDFFDKPVSNAEILEECNSIGGEFDIKQIYNATIYLYTQGIIEGERRIMETKGSGKASRAIWYYWKKNAVPSGDI